MKTNRIMKIMAAIMVMLLLPVCTGLAEKVCVMTATRAYAKPSTSAKSYKLKAGETVNLVAEQSGWAKIKKSGKVAFVDADALAEIKNYNGKTMYLSEDASLTKKMGAGKIVKALKAGDKVSLQYVVGEWAYVKASGKAGFVKESLLTSEKPGEPAPDPSKVMYVKSDNTKLFKKNSTSSKVLAKLEMNTAVTVLATKGSWCRVQAGALKGYIKKAKLASEKQEEPIEDKFDAVVVNDGAKVYKKCSDTSKVLATLKKDDTVTVTAYTSQWCSVEKDGNSGYMKRSDLAADDKPEPTPDIPEGSTAVPAKGTAKAMDWWTSSISSIFAVGTTAVVTDVETGIAWNEKRTGGTNHADVQPATAADTAAMKSAVGSWSWDRRAIFVTINGVNYAASMNCMPHGSDSISSNNFDGHHCIHFTNSRTHGTNKVCSLHQAAIQKALAANLK